MPWPLLILFVYLYMRGRSGRGLSLRSRPCLSGVERSAISLYIAVVVLTVLFLSESFIWMYFSYIVQLVPLLVVCLAVSVLWIMDRCRPLGYGLVALLLATNVLHSVPYALPVVQSFKWASLGPRPYLADTDELISTAGRLRSDLADYAYELTHDYDSPDEGIALFLGVNARRGDLVLANYGELPIAFYTGLDIAGGLSAYRLESVGQPEWVIDRRDGPYRDEMGRVLASANYEAIDISYPDILWGNRPVPEYHKYATVRDAPHLVIWHLEGGASQ
jgi:hypothetical protein